MSKKMKAAVYVNKGKVVVKEVPIPQIGQAEALIKVECAGICGTDLTIMSGNLPRVRPPLIMGHELSGEIVEMGGGETGLKVGDKVTVRPLLSCGKCYACQMGWDHVCQYLRLLGIDVDGAFAEYVKAPLETIHKLPEGVSLDLAALTEPLAVAQHVITVSNLKIGDKVAVIGAGPIGVLVALMAKRGGASKIIVSEVNEYRLELARTLGFTVIDVNKVDPVSRVLELTNGIGVDVVYEVSGTAEATLQMVDMVRIRGEIILVGVHEKLDPMNFTRATFKELVLRGSRVYTKIDYSRAIELLIPERDNLRSLISHRFGLEKASKGLDLVRQRGKAMKILLKP
ncbi:zinc-binding dehydrogenase [Candidatus Aerophobetes bacterium Ae_b3a]|nr:MAG: zinc-binding dehydrogenase [Candidatus Aerophobetes bacterium Ae_b3a]